MNYLLNNAKIIIKLQYCYIDMRRNNKLFLKLKTEHDAAAHAVTHVKSYLGPSDAYLNYSRMDTFSLVLFVYYPESNFYTILQQFCLYVVNNQKLYQGPILRNKKQYFFMKKTEF